MTCVRSVAAPSRSLASTYSRHCASTARRAPSASHRSALESPAAKRAAARRVASFDPSNAAPRAPAAVDAPPAPPAAAKADQPPPPPGSRFSDVEIAEEIAAREAIGASTKSCRASLDGEYDANDENRTPQIPS